MYYNIHNPNDIRDLASVMPAWIAAGNPKANDWLPVPEKPQFDPATHDCNWVNGAWVVTPKQPAPVPAEIPLWAFRSAIALNGLTDQVVAMINSIPEPNKTVAWQQWEYANWISRNHPTIDQISAALGLTASQVDDMFRLGASLT